MTGTIMVPKDVHVLIPETCEDVTFTWQKGPFRNDNARGLEMDRLNLSDLGGLSTGEPTSHQGGWVKHSDKNL
jgi:hypothetical protein